MNMINGSLPRVAILDIMDVEVVVGAYDGGIVGLSYDILTSSSASESARGSLLPRFNESGHLGKVSVMESSRGILVTGSSDETIKIYDMLKHTEIGSLMQHEGTITDLQFCDNRLVSCGEDGLICVWDTRTWACLHALDGHRGAVHSIAVHPSGKILLSVGKDRSIRTWNMKDGHQAFKKKFPKVPEFVKWSPVGDKYLVGFDNRQLVVYDIESGQSQQEISLGQRIYSVVFLQDSLIAIGSELPEILLYSTDDGQCISKLKGHETRVKALQFLVGVNLLVSMSSDGSIRIWKMSDDLHSGKSVCEYKLPNRLICMSVVYPQGLSIHKPIKQSLKKKGLKKRKLSTEHIKKETVDDDKCISKRKKLLLKKKGHRRL